MHKQNLGNLKKIPNMESWDALDNASPEKYRLERAAKGHK